MIQAKNGLREHIRGYLKEHNTMAERRRRKSAASQIEDRDRETPVESEEFVGPDPYKLTQTN